ncbi:STAS domain-containing protein [Streptomyces coffeae]|uniref:Anti-sigma factor antagonist n=1 Tax=Streptomyces coffeae TaxID=621382 RepID=A0ABS1N727_9ACTN|nr:STAS domain-containing protein [Streptomyces coffeae]MBL1095797.1 STAS domain-containing protein [Streptomyces coffeae]
MTQPGAPRRAPVPSDAGVRPDPFPDTAAGGLCPLPERPAAPEPEPWAVTYRVGRCTVVELHGEIDIAGLASVGPQLDAATATPAVVIDLTPTTFFDCSGLGLLCRARRRVVERGGRMRLVCAHPLILRTLRVGGLSEVFQPVPTLEEALREEEAASGGGTGPASGGTGAAPGGTGSTPGGPAEG